MAKPSSGCCCWRIDAATFSPWLKDMPEMSLGESSSQRTISTTTKAPELNAGNNMVLAAKGIVHVTSGNINAGGTAVVANNDHL